MTSKIKPEGTRISQMSMRAITLVLSLIAVSAATIGCSSQGTVYSSGPTTVQTPMPEETTIQTVSNQTVAPGKSLDMPSDGVAMKAGRTLILTWSADTQLEGHILTASQYNQYLSFRESGKNSHSSSTQLTNGTITLYVTSDDTFYAVLINTASAGSPAVQVHQAMLTER